MKRRSLFCLTLLAHLVLGTGEAAVLTAEPVNASEAPALADVWVAPSLEDQFVVKVLDENRLTICGPFFANDSAGQQENGPDGTTVWSFPGYTFTGSQHGEQWSMRITGSQNPRDVVFVRASPATVDGMLARINVINGGIRKALALRHAPPAPLMRTAPQYPFEMKQAAIEGKVTVQFEVNEIGLVATAQIKKATRREFEPAVLAAVSRWIFRPGIRDGRFVRTRMTQELDFAIDPGEKRTKAAPAEP